MLSTPKQRVVAGGQWSVVGGEMVGIPLPRRGGAREAAAGSGLPLRGKLWSIGPEPTGELLAPRSRLGQVWRSLNPWADAGLCHWLHAAAACAGLSGHSPPEVSS